MSSHQQVLLIGKVRTNGYMSESLHHQLNGLNSSFLCLTGLDFILYEDSWRPGTLHLTRQPEAECCGGDF